LQTISHNAYLALRARAFVIERDAFGDKVLRQEDGGYVKLFRRKRWISSAAWYPYAQRFADNAGRLHALAIPCPEVTGIYRIPTIERDAVTYRPLVGDTLRTLAEKEGYLPLRLISQIGTFIARLHANGVYFRSLHSGNVLLCPDGQFGLIDIADMRIARRPLRHAERVRNFRHLLRAPRDRQILLPDGGEALLAAYGDPRVAALPKHAQGHRTT
jgi:hypothetical protein